ncbi:MAG: Hpt domain-containing protein [Gemmatimonadales bacterium]|nr:Hpt domain-containing protein [Gemmatimonadales bacterium]
MDQPLPRESASLDPEGIARLRRLGGDALIAKVLTAFLRDMPARAAAARAALRARDSVRLAGALHPMVSTAWNVGAVELAALAREAEHAAKAEAWPALFDLVGRTSATVAAVCDALEPLVQRPAA